MRKVLLGFALVLAICVAFYVRFYHVKPPLEVAYSGGRQVTLWSTTAQVREPVATVSFGERLDVLEHFQDQVKVRTMTGMTGWVNERDLLSADLWQRAIDLEARSAAMPVEARGHTKVLSNLHIEPGRKSPRIRQLNKQIPVDLLERQVVEVPAATAPGEEEEAAGEPTEAKKEDWWLVRAHSPDQISIAGWVLGRFIDLDVPSPLPDYASSAGMHIVAWFELNRVVDASKNSRPQYLVVGVRGPEGQPCDFTVLRVYTWGIQGRRYETAFVGSDLCGKLPVKLTQPTVRGGDVTFTFEDSSRGEAEERTYRMHQTIVRRIRKGDRFELQEHPR